MIETHEPSSRWQFDHPSALAEVVGSELGTSGWHTVTQEQVDAFAFATGDYTWMHVDPDRAATGPFGGAIAHGFLTLSLIWVLAAEIYDVGGISHSVNYGVDTVRFITPVRTGSRVRVSATLVDVSIDGTKYRTTVRFVVQAESEPTPACIAHAIIMYFATSERDNRAKDTIKGA